MPTVDRRIPLLLAWCAALAMVAFTGWQIYQFWQTGIAVPRTSTTVKAPDQPSPTTSTTPDVDLSQLELFGSAQSAQPTPAPVAKALPETELRLILRGALAADGEFPGSALIEDPDGQTDVYMPGDSLPGNAQLKTVFADRVIIQRNDNLENLYFPEADNPLDLALSSEQQGSAVNGSSDQQSRREEIRNRLQQLRQRLQDSN